MNFHKLSFTKYLSNYILSYDLPLGDSQVRVWDDCFDFLQLELSKLDGSYDDVSMIFEYMLPLEKFRRPDVVLLFEKCVTILEFKQKNMPQADDIEQAIGYREDITNFHYVTDKYKMNVKAFIVVTKSKDEATVCRGIQLLNNKNFIDEVFKDKPKALGDDYVTECIQSRYEPLPSIIDATAIGSALGYSGAAAYTTGLSLLGGGSIVVGGAGMAG